MTTMGELESTTYRRLGILLMVIGGLFAANHYVGLLHLTKLWPLLTLSLGIGFVGIFMKRRARGTFYLALGEYLALFSCLALYLNFTAWKQLEQLWPLFVGFLGVVFATLLAFRRKNRFYLFLTLLFFLLTAAFFLIWTFGTEYWWSILVLVGLSVIIAGRRP